MMPSELTFEEGLLGVEGIVTYEPRDLSLWYATENERVPSIQMRRFVRSSSAIFRSANHMSDMRKHE